MSRGLGTHQRRILEALEPSGWLGRRISPPPAEATQRHLAERWQALRLVA